MPIPTELPTRSSPPAALQSPSDSITPASLHHPDQLCLCFSSISCNTACSALTSPVRTDASQHRTTSIGIIHLRSLAAAHCSNADAVGTLRDAQLELSHAGCSPCTHSMDSGANWGDTCRVKQHHRGSIRVARVPRCPRGVGIFAPMPVISSDFAAL